MHKPMDDGFESQEERQQKLNEMLVYACSTGNREVFASAVLAGADANYDNIAAARWAAKKGDLLMLNHLIGICDVKALDSALLSWAASTGNVEFTEKLIPLSDPKAKNSNALRMAAKNGFKVCTDLLLPVSDPADYGTALCYAAAEGHMNIVEDLCKFVEDTDIKVRACAIAEKNAFSSAGEKGKRQIGCVDVILDSFDVQTVATQYEQQGKHEFASYLQAKILDGCIQRKNDRKNAFS